MKYLEKLRRVLFSVLAAWLAALAAVSFAADRDDVFDILDSWTCVRWGEDNIAWIVHYPEELVEPWVRSEAARQNMRPEQIDELRKSFSDELRIGSATAILLSVYGYGAEQTNLAPMAKNIVLIDSSGKRIAPIVFEKKLDGPISGLAQGFVFFPLQSDKNFRISVKGLVPDRETNFTFTNAAAPRGGIETVSSPSAPASDRQFPDAEVVVKIPTRKNAPDKPARPDRPQTEPPKSPELEADTEVFAPSEPAALPEPEIQPPEVTSPESGSPEPEKLIEVVTAQRTPKGTLDDYLKAWAAGDTDTMYSLLSFESQGRISKELFAREVMSGGFRNALRSGYRVNWTGNTAKVTVAKRVLFVRTLETKQLNFVAENDAWRVAW
ncbi:MAG: hypothetical protein LBS35_07750 [Synergistaceae bacterium]|jgi:hypothetical protein|nr:hypothetical protein [Synergistaceae bacterium]